MPTERVSVKVDTLLKLRGLVESGDSVAALELLERILDRETQAKFRNLREDAYRRYKSGEYGHDQYQFIRSLWENCLL